MWYVPKNRETRSADKVSWRTSALQIPVLLPVEWLISLILVRHGVVRGEEIGESDSHIFAIGKMPMDEADQHWSGRVSCAQDRWKPTSSSVRHRRCLKCEIGSVYNSYHAVVTKEEDHKTF